MRPISPLLQQSLSFYNIRLLQNKVNSLFKKCNHSNNNKDSKNIVDKGKAKNYSNGSDNSGNTVNNDVGDGDSSNSNNSNEAYGCVGRRESPTFISG